MYNAKTLIAGALSADNALIVLVPAVRMFDGIAVFTGEPIYPYITFEEIGNTEGLQADDEEIESEVTFRIHVWHTASTTTIAGNVNRILKSIDFTRNNANDQNERLETGQIIRHKIMSYSSNFKI